MIPLSFFMQFPCSDCRTKRGVWTFAAFIGKRGAERNARRAPGSI
ncbi:hypothetical protein CLJ1_4031 [Pseudomonas paraeruginosa]|nr:hypothetical protein CLJ1_4031 [Pseudomonas aeruginosa]